VAHTKAWTFDLELGPDATTPRAVRRKVAEAYADHPRKETLLLCVSEVVTNAVLHARTPIELHLRDDGTTIRVEVRDESTVAPVRRHVESASPTGRGLHLLDRLADRWGVEMRSDGKTVWFEFHGEPSP
jgi:anti-sigma regulatory factor (Ser/Thr protein kinase)